MKFFFLATIPFTLLLVGCDEDTVRPHLRIGDMAQPNNNGLPDMAEIPLPDGSEFTDDGPSPLSGDPQTCADATAAKSYVGCDYWPTVVANPVDSDFDFAVAVANTGMTAANITITGPSGTNQTGTVAPSSLTKFYLPWVTSLKGQDAFCGAGGGLTRSVKAAKGAFHLVSDRPVTVYQFNALEYQGVGGPPGKDWSQCLNAICGLGCFSFSNDASLLLPSTAMTGNYRVAGQLPGESAYFAVTATADATTVKIKLSASGKITAGSGSSGITAVAAGGTATYTLDAGDVIELLGGSSPSTADLSGSQIQADKPVQVITGDSCIENPAGKAACDHIEESLFPVETLGKDYVVTVPTAPAGDIRGHTVRIYGNVDNTMLTYNPPLTGVKTTINAGEVIDVGQTLTDFEVSGDHEFMVANFMLGGSVVDPQASMSKPSRGDPSQSMMVAVAQWRTKYVFLAPNDYDVSYVDIVAPLGTNVTLDGATITLMPKQIGTTNYGVIRQKLTAGMAGAHVLTSDQPVGLQVEGYGSYTSYQYPGGLDLQVIAPVPPPIS